MLMLALAAWEGPAGEAAGEAAARRGPLCELAAGLLHQQQQRGDGAFAVYFEPAEYASSDAGWQLYGGEAAYALATAFGGLHNPALLAAAARALRAYQAKYRRRVDGEHG